MKPAISIVILNYNGRKHLETFLPSVLQHNIAGATVYVADNGSTDESVAYLNTTFPEVTLCELPENYGFAEGYNQALKNIPGDYYVILNSDVRVTQGWLDAPIALMEADDCIAAVQPKIRSSEKPTHFEYAGAAGGLMDRYGYTFCRGRIFEVLEADTGQHNRPIEITWASGAALFIRAALYHRFGGFDGDYFAHMEEIDLCWRLRRAGYRIMATPDSEVYHLGGGTLDYQSPRKTFLNFRNIYFTLFKNLSTAKLCWLIPLRLVLDAAAALQFIMKGRLDLVGAIARAHWAFFGQFFYILKKRKATKAIVAQHRIGSENKSAIYPRSIILAYYFKKQKTYHELPHVEKE